ncbi:MAG: T9SS type A sorting domain-containing protein [Bacteroidetes bacterium]|nr:T9SS type A sorting domain-containing protein [Bacteroidota bacterium]
MKLRYLFSMALIAIFALQFSATAQIVVFPSYTEDFESSNGGWSASGTNSTWAWGTPVGNSITTAGSGTKCWKTNLNGNYNNSETSYMTSPIFDFSCLTADPTLTFMIAHYLESNYDYGVVQLSTDGGTTWTTLGSTSSGGTNWYQTASGWNGNRAWVTASHVLTGMAGKSSVMIRIRLTSDSSVAYGGIGIDLVNINLAGATLTTPTLVSPADFAIGVAISPTLSWNASTCASGYDVQVATDPAFTTLVANIAGNVGTSVAVGPLAGSTVHYWRVRATRGAIVSNWTPTRTFTTLFPPPPPPVLSLPTNNATAQSLSTVLNWLPALGAASYNVQVSTNASFIGLLVDSSLTGTSLTLSKLQNYTVYYWRVNATNVSGTSAYSTVWNFRTLIASTALSNPVTSTMEIQIPSTLSWVNVPGLTGYRLQLSTAANFSTIAYDNATITTSTFSVPNLLNNTKYYWRVKCIGTGGEESDWSVSWNFTTIIATPILALPAPGAGDVNPKLTVSWNPVGGQPGYQVQISTTVVFLPGTVTFDSTVASGTSVFASSLSNNTFYYWRVRAVSPTSGKSLWSEIQTFTTIYAVTTLVSPTDQSKNQPIPLLLQWNSVGAKATYRIQIATDVDFKSIVIDEDKLGGSSIQYGAFKGLKNNTEYYWRVQPLSISGVEIPWTATWKFKTMLSATTLIAPKNGQSNLDKAINFTWANTDGASSYMLQVARDNKFVDKVIDLVGLIGTSKTIFLETDTRYYWRMKSTSTDNGSGDWSEVWSFGTGVQAATIPALSLPEDKAKNVPTDVEFTWKDAVGAATYELQISRTADFKNVLVNQSGLTTTSYKSTGLAAKETYYWRVQSVNTSGASGWSDPWSFTVIVAAPATVSLLLPANNAKNQTIALSLKWNAVQDAETYTVQVSEKSDFSTKVVDDKTITAPIFTVSKLKYETEYYWRVMASNVAGDGAWSETWNFTTDKEVGVAESPDLGLSLSSYPNPMNNGIGTLELNLKQRANVRVSVISLLGVETLELLNGILEAGSHTSQWNSVGMASGMYFIKLETGGKVLSIPVTISDTK